MRTARQIAEELLGSPISQEGYALCPGAHLHTTPTGPHDFRLWLDGDNATKPREYCFHTSCAVARDEFMRRLYVALARERRGNDNARRNNSPIQRQYIAPPPCASALSSTSPVRKSWPQNAPSALITSGSGRTHPSPSPPPGNNGPNSS